MIKPKSQLIEELEKKIKVLDDVKIQKHSMDLMKQYNFKVGYATKLLNFEKIFDDESDFILFCLADILGINVDEYFSEFEITQFRDADYNKNQLPKKIDLDAIEIGENQWICQMKVSEFMKYNHDQLIRYNANTQRALTVQVHGDVEYLVPTVNMHRVDEIANAMMKGTFFPTPIVLNMSYDDETIDHDFKDGKLIITNPTFFDIIDGQHRNLAACQCYNKDKNFDYYFPVIFTRLTELQARDFIVQQDKKEHFKKGENKTFDQSNVVNKIINYIKNDRTYGNMIKPTGIIPESVLYLYISKEYKVDDLPRSKQMKIVKDIVDLLTNIDTEYPEIYDVKQNTSKEFLTILLCVKYGKFNKYTDIKEYINRRENRIQVPECTTPVWKKLIKYIEEV